jgi:hypothetical protein
MKFRSETERAIYAAAFVRAFEDAHEYGVTNWARAEAEKTGENVVGTWESGIAIQALESAEGVVQIYRKALRDE